MSYNSVQQLDEAPGNAGRPLIYNVVLLSMLYAKQGILFKYRMCLCR